MIQRRCVISFLLAVSRELYQFHVIYPRASQNPPGNKHPKPTSIKLTKVAEINPESVL